MSSRRASFNLGLKQIGHDCDTGYTIAGKFTIRAAFRLAVLNIHICRINLMRRSRSKHVPFGWTKANVFTPALCIISVGGLQNQWLSKQPSVGQATKCTKQDPFWDPRKWLLVKKFPSEPNRTLPCSQSQHATTAESFVLILSNNLRCSFWSNVFPSFPSFFIYVWGWSVAKSTITATI
jgi:hypothetical protein